RGRVRHVLRRRHRVRARGQADGEGGGMSPQRARAMQALSGTPDLALGWYAVRMAPMDNPEIATDHFIHFELDPAGKPELVGRPVTVEMRQNYVDEADKGILITSTTVAMPEKLKQFRHDIDMYD